MNNIEKYRKEDMDPVIAELKKSPIRLDGEFELQFEYIEREDILPCCQGFSMTIWPKGRDGYGINVKFDPYDTEVCSGVAEVIGEHKRKKQ